MKANLVKAFSNSTFNLIELALWWDPEIPEKKPDGLPLARFLAPGQMQNAVFRSGFNGKGDTIVLYLFSDYYDGDSSGGLNWGSFKIFKDEYLVGHSFGGPHLAVSYGHSNLSFWDTSTRQKTGWDFPVKPEHGHGYHQISFIKSFPKQTCGTVKAFETSQEFDYLAFESSPHYYKREQVKEWTGQVVFLRPGILVRFDRAEVTDPKYQPRFFLHMKGEKPVVKGKRIQSIVYNHVDDFNASEVTYRGQLQKNKIHLQILLPHQRVLRVVQGHLMDSPSKSLLNTRKRTIASRGKGTIFTLKMIHKTSEGIQKIPALNIHAASQRRSGIFSASITKNSKLRMVQTAAMINENIPFRMFPTFRDLMERLETSGFQTTFLGNFETWVEGNSIRRSCLEGAPINPGYRFDGSMATSQREKIIKGNPYHRNDITNPQQSGHLEIRIPIENTQKRHYFLNVITATDVEEKDCPVPETELKEDDQQVTAIVKYGSKTAYITFQKTGELKGHIKIEENGKALVDRELIQKIKTENQAFGSDFLTGRRIVKK